MTPNEFIDDWRSSALNERPASQKHFIDLCRPLGEPTPAEADPSGETYCFERGARMDTGGSGWADVLSQNVPLEDVQYLAGHAHPRTTQIYDAPAPARLSQPRRADLRLKGSFGHCSVRGGLQGGLCRSLTCPLQFPVRLDQFRANLISESIHDCDRHKVIV